MAFSISLDYNNALSDVVASPHGIAPEMLRDLAPRARDAHARFLKRRQDDVGFYDLANVEARSKELRDVARLGNKIAERFANFVVLGIGGSALGPACVQRALGHLHYNLLVPAARNNRPRIFVLDNIDPKLLAEFLDVASPAKTCFNVITKSGTTPETISQFMAFYDLVVRAVGREKARDHFVITTQPTESPLRPLAEKMKMEWLPIDKTIGGRFSELSAVGLLPAAVAGFNIRAMVRGAERMAKVCNTDALADNPAYLNGAIHYLADTERGKTISVMMPYSEALRDVADWYRQLWAESLGKRRGAPPQEVCVGQTPVRSLGTTDQHSQVQLYVDGPNDKIFTFLRVENYGKKFPVTAGLNDALPGFQFLSNHDISDLFDAEFLGTEYALTQAQRPSVRINLKRVDEEHVGGLLFMLMVQTAFTGMLYDIDPFDQPGVEMGKKAAAALMERNTPADVEMLKAVNAYKENRQKGRVVSVEE